MTTRNWIAVGLTLVSLALLVPGLRNDALTITASIPIFNKPTEIFKETQSILRAVKRLYDSKNYLVAAIIVLFSVLVPFIKVALMAVALKATSPATRHRTYLFIRGISKWAMADVFAVGIFIAFLAGNAMDNLDAQIQPGLYYFVGYCLVSNIAFQFLYIPPPDQAPTEITSPA